MTATCTLTTVREFIAHRVEATAELLRASGSKQETCLVEKFVIEHGRQWDRIETDLAAHHVEPGRIKECFRNAAILALHRERFTYVEGFACGVIPVHHAWVVTADGTVVDNTWPTPGTDYFGVPFRKSALLRELQHNRTYGLLDQWQSNYRLARMSPAVVRKSILAAMKGGAR